MVLLAPLVAATFRCYTVRVSKKIPPYSNQRSKFLIINISCSLSAPASALRTYANPIDDSSRSIRRWVSPQGSSIRMKLQNRLVVVKCHEGSVFRTRAPALVSFNYLAKRPRVTLVINAPSSARPDKLYDLKAAKLETAAPVV